jgi:hypothetical protein
MEEIIKRFQEIIEIKNNNCNNKCSECLLNQILKEIWYDCDYEEIDICNFINLLENKIIK